MDYKEIDFNKKADLTLVGEAITCHSKDATPFYIRYYFNHNDVYSVLRPDMSVRDAKSIFDYNYKLHVHQYNELILVLGKDMVANINGNIYTAKAGDIMVTRVDEPHFYTPLKEGENEYIQIDIPVDAFDGVADSDIFVNCFNNRGFCENNLFSPEEFDKELLMKTAGRIISLLNTAGCNQMLIYSQFIQLMNTINNVFEKKSGFSADKSLPSNIFEAVRYIHANLGTIGSLKEIADHLNVTVPYFSRIFKKEMNCTPHDYIVNQRIERAKRLMCVKDMNVYEACFESGFNDYSGFISVFKKKVGVTPLVYKKSFS